MQKTTNTYQIGLAIDQYVASIKSQLTILESWPTDANEEMGDGSFEILKAEIIPLLEAELGFQKAWIAKFKQELKA